MQHRQAPDHGQQCLMLQHTPSLPPPPFIPILFPKPTVRDPLLRSQHQNSDWDSDKAAESH